MISKEKKTAIMKEYALKEKEKIEPNKKEEKNDVKQDEKKEDNQLNQIPEKFNLADHINLTVGNQGSYGLCWDFASMKSLETNLMLTQR